MEPCPDLPAHTVAHAAAQCTYARVPTEKQNFGIYLGKPPANAVRTVMAGKRVKATIRSHCFKLTNNAMRGASPAASPAACDAAELCCDAESSRLATLVLSASKCAWLFLCVYA